MKFSLGYARDKLLVFRHVLSPRWAFWFYELRYSLANAWHLLIGGQGQAVWHGAEQVVTSRGTFRVRIGSQDASVISPAFERPDMERLLKLLYDYQQSGPVTFLDVGANIGRFTITVGKTLPQVNVWAFEPDPENFKVLLSNYRLNNLTLPQVQLFSVALGEKVEQLDLYGSKIRGGDHTFKPSANLQKVATVLVKPLEQWLKTLSPDTAVVLKLDVEGFEIEVLKGIGSLRGRFRSFDLMIEDITQRDKIYEFLRQKQATPTAKLTPYNSWWRFDTSP
ncbi:MAG: FkbM family methyltransferase [Bdellovibrionales bacterium]